MRALAGAIGLLLVLSGTLHAQGYDHEAGEKEALEMEALEILLMGALGFPNPY